MIALLMAHPALGVVLSCSVTMLGLFGYLSVRRICLAVERCRGAAPAAPKKTRKDAAPSEPAPATVATKTCARCGQETSSSERHEIYCALYDDNAKTLRQALTSLGYKQHEIDKALPKLDLGLDSMELLIKAALKEMPSKSKGGVS